MNDKIKFNNFWHVESLRFTLIYSIENRPSINGLIEKITGSLPSNRTERPQENYLVEEGLWQENLLSIVSYPDRIDLLFSSNAAPSAVPRLSNVGLIDDVVPIAASLLDNISFAEVTRIAFGLILIHPEHDHAGAYQTLQKLLPNVKIESDAREFLYQINLPFKLKKHPEIEINSLRKVSAIVFKYFNVFESTNKNIKELFASRIELDINTHQDFVLNSSYDIQDMMNGLIEEAVAIAEGDTHA